MDPGRGIEGKERAVKSRYPMGFMSYYYIVTGVKKIIIPPEPAVLASQVGRHSSEITPIKTSLRVFFRTFPKIPEDCRGRSEDVST